jgi:hypothetical protein
MQFNQGFFPTARNAVSFYMQYRYSTHSGLHPPFVSIAAQHTAIRLFSGEIDRQNNLSHNQGTAGEL